MKIIKDICYGAADLSDQKLDLYLPDSKDFPVFIYFHGGGIESGDKGEVSLVGEYLASECNIAFVSCNYRMYPDASYPDFINDAAEAVAYIHNHIKEYGNAAKIVIGGSSAGAYISMMLAFDKKYLGQFGINPDIFDGYIHDAGQPTSHFNVLREKGIDSRRVIIDETAPLYHICENPDYPKMLFIVSDDDMENRYEQTMLTLSTLKHMNGKTDKFSLKIMHGTHCHYVGMKDDEDSSVLGQIAKEFIIDLK